MLSKLSSVYNAANHLFTACSMACSYKRPSFGPCPSIGEARAERRTVEPQIRTRASPHGLSFSIVTQDGLLWQIRDWRDFRLPRSVRIEQSWMCDWRCVLRMFCGEYIASEHFLHGHIVRPQTSFAHATHFQVWIARIGVLPCSGDIWLDTFSPYR